MKGIWAAVLTPVDAALVPDASCAIPYYGELLGRGCDGINLLGTTGEAMSFSADQRLTFMEAIGSSGLPRDRVMAGTGAASLGDAVRLTRRAFELGFAAALIMPPFFFREASEDGTLAFFEALVARTSPPRKSIMLYNFPRMSGITFHAALVDRLLDEFPDAIGGMKDSSNDDRLQAELHARRPGFWIFPGSERDLLAAKARGVAGCVSGSVALWPELASAAFATADQKAAAELSEKRALLDGFPFIPAVRHLTATALRSPQWERAMPPHQPLSADRRRALARAVQCNP